MSNSVSSFQQPRQISGANLPVASVGQAIPANGEPATILIAEDMAGLRTHAAAILQHALATPLKIIQAGDGQEAVEMALNCQPDLVIMDIALPQVNGIKAAQQIWSVHAKTRILFWSEHYREIYVRDLARIVPDEAVHGYVLKTSSDENFIYAVSCLLLYDNPYLDPVVRTARSGLSHKKSCLTDAELETLNDLALGLTDKAIAMRHQLSLRGVQNRIGCLYAKLLKREDEILKQRAGGTEIVNQRARLIFEALRRGLIVPEDFVSLNEGFGTWFDGTFG